MSKEKNLRKLEWPSPKQIKTSNENPRSDDFYKDKDFLRLKQSVAKYGVLVPIIIKRLSKEVDKIKYQLIDGERRWRAAIETNRDKIPAYVLPPVEQVDILTTMFQIHMNQAEWDALEQARALEKIISTLKKDIHQKYHKKEEIEKELRKRLIEMTGMDEANALSRVRFFRWPKNLREDIYNEQSKNYYSYAVEIEARIVEPALRNFKDIKNIISPNDMRKALFEKVTGKYVSRAEEIRDAAILTKRRRDKKQASNAKSLLLQFIKDKTFTFPEAREQYLFLFPEETQKPPLSPRKLINTIRTIIRVFTEYTNTTIKKLKIKQKSELKKVLKELLSIIKDTVKRLE